MIEIKPITIAKKISSQRRTIFSIFSQNFLIQNLNKYSSTIIVSRSKNHPCHRYVGSYQKYYNKGVRSEQLSILVMKGSKKYLTLGISCNGNALLPIEQTVNIVLKQIVYDESTKEIHRINMVSPTISLDDFKKQFMIFRECANETFKQVCVNLIDIFNMELFCDPATSKELRVYIDKHHFFFYVNLTH